MELNLKGKRVLVTGASKGIGRACVEMLTAEGCTVLGASRSIAPGPAAKASDLSQRGAAEDLAAWAGELDILVNNAGAIPGGDLQGVNEDVWRKAWDLKVFGYVNMCRRFYALMKARGQGVIVNVVGNAADTHDPEYICGVAGNAALTAFSQSLGCVSAKDGIRVIALSPGPVETDRIVTLMKKKAKDRTGDENNWQELRKPLPFQRCATPDEIGAMAAFLASPLSGYTSGSVVTIDAGLSARATAF